MIAMRTTFEITFQEWPNGLSVYGRLYDLDAHRSLTYPIQMPFICETNEKKGNGPADLGILRESRYVWHSCRGGEGELHQFR